ncbi:MAG: hypothetical protein D6749_12475, partial [Chloroflexota bacterium]
FERHSSGLGLSWGGDVIAIRAADGTILARFFCDAWIRTAAWSPVLKRVVAGDAAGRVLFLRWIE